MRLIVVVRILRVRGSIVVGIFHRALRLEECAAQGTKESGGGVTEGTVLPLEFEKSFLGLSSEESGHEPWWEE